MVKVILMDVEGTTTSLSFVKDVLFPYAKKRLPSYLQENRNRDDVNSCLLQVNATVSQEENKQNPLSLEDSTKYLLHWIDVDRKHPALKTLQGYIWQEGYKRKEFYGHVYEDVPRAFERWKKQGYKMAIYSSGSVQAQRLLFQNTIYGDLTPYLCNYFDTNVGHKQEEDSYRNIFSMLVEAMPEIIINEILFLSDISGELQAAQHSGMRTLRLIRPDFPRENLQKSLKLIDVKSFDELVEIDEFDDNIINDF